MFKGFILSAVLALAGCSALDKDNEPHEPVTPEQKVQVKLNVYRPLIAGQLDSHGLVTMEGSIGDSALFSCLARAAGAAHFDPAILFVNGKPVRHPDIAPSASAGSTGSKGTPISKDMVSGVLWCLYDLHQRGDDDHASELVSAMIDFGKAHKATFGPVDIGWMFCTNEDKAAYEISEQDWYGKCFMPAGVVKDIYRLAKLVGVECDQTCQEFMVIGPNIPSDNSGYQRHLAVIGTARNGFVEGGINDNSLKTVLQKAAQSQPRNGLYLAAYHTFVEGDQASAYEALLNESLFPADTLPTDANYCTEYLFQRDDDSAGRSDGGKPDWTPCGDGAGGSQGRGVEFAFAAAFALGEFQPKD